VDARHKAGQDDLAETNHLNASEDYVVGWMMPIDVPRREDRAVGAHACDRRARPAAVNFQQSEFTAGCRRRPG
jgi:hypothetical protein